MRAPALKPNGFLIPVGWGNSADEDSILGWFRCLWKKTLELGKAVGD